MIQDNLVRKSNVSTTVGFTADCDFVCDGVADNIQIQAAIDKIAAKGGGIVYIRDGNYTFNCAVYPKSNVEINMSTATVIKMDDQQVWTLPEATTANTQVVTVTDEILNYVIPGQNVGFTDGTPGYIWENQTTRHGNFITEVDKENKTITLALTLPNASFTTMVTMDCAFMHFDPTKTTQGTQINNVKFYGGIIDGNKANQTVWMHDAAQNAFVIGDCNDIIVENIEVKNFFFQGIHLMVHSDLNHRDGKTVVIRNCIAHDFDFSGICIDSSAHVSVENCVAYNCLYGIQGVHIEKINVTNCTVKSCTGAGITFDGNPYRDPSVDLDNNLIITDNNLFNNPSGIIIQYAKNSIISNNIIWNNTVSGIDLRDATQGFSLIGNTLINNGVAIKETADCLDNTAYSNTLRDNSTDYDIHTMQVGENSSVLLEKKSATLLEAKETNGTSIGGVVVDEGLITPEFTFVDLTDLPEVGVEHNGYLTAKPIENLKPNTPYTIWTDAPQYYSDYGTLYYGSITIRSTEEYGGVATWTSDENGVIWIWVIQGRSNEQGYIDGTYKVTIKEGTQPQPYVIPEVTVYTDKPSSDNKIVTQSALTTVTLGRTEGFDYVCDGVADDRQFTEAINELYSRGGGTLLVADGNYVFNSAVHFKSNVDIRMSTNTYIKMNAQQMWELPESPDLNSKTVKVTDKILDYITVGQFIGLTYGETGYLTREEQRFTGFISAIDIENKTITVHDFIGLEGLTHLVTIDSAFMQIDAYDGPCHNVHMCGGIIDGDNEHQFTWMHDMGHNGIIGCIDGWIIENVVVKDFFFQGIHPMLRAGELNDDPPSPSNWGVPITVRGCYIYDCRFAGVCIDSTKYANIEDCVAYNCGSGCQVVFSENIQVINFLSVNCNTGCSISGNTYLLTKDHYINLERCTAINCREHGIWMNNSPCSTITDCLINNTPIGIRLLGVTRKVSLVGTTIIGASNTGIIEDNTCSDNVATALVLRNNTRDYNVSTMKIGDNNSDVDFKKHSNNVLYVEDHGNKIGGTIVDPSLIELPTLIELGIPAMKDTWVVRDGYGNAKEITGLEPNTPYTMWTDAPTDQGGTLYYGDLGPSVEESGGYKTATTDENGSIWFWVVNGRSLTQDYYDEVYKVTLVEGTTPQPYIDTSPVMYTSKPSSSNKVVCQAELTTAIQTAITNAIGGSY